MLAKRIVFYTSYKPGLRIRIRFSSMFGLRSGLQNSVGSGMNIKIQGPFSSELFLPKLKWNINLSMI